MTTQRIYSHSLVGFLVLALSVVLGAGGCGTSSSTGWRAVESDNQVPGLAGSEGMTYAEDDAEMVCDEPTADEYETSMPMGYQEPGYSDTMESGTVTDDESSDATTCYDEEEASTEVTEESGMVEEDSNYDDAAWTPVVTEEEDTSSQNNDMDDGSMTTTTDEEEIGDPTVSEESNDETTETPGVTEEEGTSAQTDEGSSNTVAPWIGGEDEMSDPNPDDTTSDIDDTSDDAPVSD